METNRMTLRPAQEFRQKLTPESIQSLQLLALPCRTLESFLEKMALENPLVEVLPDPESGECLPDGGRIEESDWDDAYSGMHAAPEGAPAGEGPAFVRPDETESLPCLMRLQLSERKLPGGIVRAAEQIIEGLDADGYFRGALSEVARRARVSEQEAEDALAAVQSLQPRGVGARTSGECLALQVDGSRADAAVLRAMLTNDLPAIAARFFNELSARYGVSRRKLQQMLSYVRTLEPYPGRAFQQSGPPEYVCPDMSVRKTGAGLSLRVRSTGSFMRFSPEYLQLLRGGALDDASGTYLQQKYREAQALYKCLEMRETAIRRLMGYLLREQAEFFRSGSAALRPMTMKQAAAAIGMSQSTVCRCVSGKYVSTDFGTFALKSLFTAQLGSDGDAVSAAAAKAAVREVIASENREKPMSDQAVANALRGRGIRISRRTVAKYRAEAGIGNRGLRMI